MSSTWPGYLALFESGELARRARAAVDALADCTLCPRRCHADRRGDSSPQSYCRTGRRAVVSGAFPHHGEEDCLRGTNGSGTIFFCQCNLRCVFCQNFEISWEGHGRPANAEQLADLMIRLQERGCHNINFVTPSHVAPHILEALVRAAARGLRIPLVYNSGGYDRVETLRWFDGVVDIYMPDLKFWRPETAHELANAIDYPETAQAAIKEMQRQVGDLVLDEHGLARRGLLVRHLLLPGGLDEARQIFRFLVREVSPEVFVNVMAQYRPEGFADEYPLIARALRPGDLEQAMAIAREEGVRRFAREPGC
jgi:putative pyruvate formate lyase activating enzyme